MTSCGRKATYEDVNAQIELFAIQKHWLRQIFLYSSMLTSRTVIQSTSLQPSQIIRQPDATPLATTIWLYNVHTVTTFTEAQTKL